MNKFFLSIVFSLLYVSSALAQLVELMGTQAIGMASGAASARQAGRGISMAKDLVEGERMLVEQMAKSPFPVQEESSERMADSVRKVQPKEVKVLSQKNKSAYPNSFRSPNIKGREDVFLRVRINQMVSEIKSKYSNYTNLSKDDFISRYYSSYKWNVGGFGSRNFFVEVEGVSMVACGVLRDNLEYIRLYVDGKQNAGCSEKSKMKFIF